MLLNKIKNKKDLYFTFSFVFLQGARFFPYLLVAKYFGVSEAGAWVLLLVILNFSKLSSFGVPNAMNRTVPILLGEKKYGKVKAIENGVFWWVAFTSGVFGIICTLYFEIVDKLEYQTITRYIFWLSIEIGMYQYYEMNYKSRGKFKEITNNQILLGCALITSSVVAWLFKSIELIYFGYFLSYSIAIALLVKKIKIKRCWFYIKKIKKIGDHSAWLFAITLISLLNMSIDKIFISSFIGIRDLGLYSITMMITGGLMLVPAAIAQIKYRNMGYEFGEAKSVSKLFDMAIKNSIENLKITAVISISSIFIIEYLVSTFLTEYAEAISVVRIHCLAVIVYSIYISFANMMLVVARYAAMCFTTLFSLVINSGLLWLAYLSPKYLNINVIAYSYLISLIMQTILIIVICRKIAK